MIQKMRKNEQGFTLIELMIVVAIIGILAAIAIPNFVNYQLKSKTAEAKVNLGAIATSEESYRAENDVYKACADYPGTAKVGTAKLDWVKADSGDFATIGFAPAGKVYYSYLVNGTSATAFLATAEGDLDKKDNKGKFTMDQDRAFTNVSPKEF